MITAMQSAKIDSANALRRARTDIASTLSSVCWTVEQSRTLSELVTQIDAKIEELIPK